MNTKLVAGVIWLSTRRKSPVAGPSGEPCDRVQTLKEIDCILDSLVSVTVEVY